MIKFRSLNKSGTNKIFEPLKCMVRGHEIVVQISKIKI